MVDHRVVVKVVVPHGEVHLGAVHRCRMNLDLEGVVRRCQMILETQILMEVVPHDYVV